MTDKEKLIKLVIEHPHLAEVLTRIVDEYRKDEKIVREHFPDATEEDLDKLWTMTVNRNCKKVGIE